MTDKLIDKPVAIGASDAPPRTKPSNYPEPFASRMAGRVKRPLGDLFGIKSFGVKEPLHKFLIPLSIRFL